MIVSSVVTAAFACVHVADVFLLYYVYRPADAADATNDVDKAVVDAATALSIVDMACTLLLPVRHVQLCVQYIGGQRILG